MFDLTSPLSFHYTPRVLRCMKPNKDTFCCLQTRSYIIYFLNSSDSCSPVVCGFRSLSLLYIPFPRQISLSLTFCRADCMLGAMWREAVWSQEAGSASVCLSASGREELSPLHPLLLSFSEGHLKRLLLRYDSLQSAHGFHVNTDRE